MKNNYTELYKEILADDRDISLAKKVEHVWKKNRLQIQAESFRVMFTKWKNKKKNKAQPKPATIKTVSYENAFSAMVQELVPDLNPLNLPESREAEYKPYLLPKNHNDILLINDIHVPYHNIPALTAALKYGMENEVNTIIINGDLIDFYAISRFQKDPRKRDLANEIIMTREFLVTLRKLFPTQAIYYKLGNHDIRWDIYLMNNAPDLLGLEEFTMESILKLEALNITMIPDKQLIHAGKLTILHGHEFQASVFSPVNVARGLYLRAKDNAICGHHHQTSEHTEPNINGKVTTCWSVACLCELHPDYAPINKFTHGFAHVKVFDNGEFEVSNYRIVNGRIK